MSVSVCVEVVSGGGARRTVPCAINSRPNNAQSPAALVSSRADVEPDAASGEIKYVVTSVIRVTSYLENREILGNMLTVGEMLLNYCCREN